MFYLVIRWCHTINSVNDPIDPASSPNSCADLFGTCLTVKDCTLQNQYICESSKKF